MAPGLSVPGETLVRMDTAMRIKILGILAVIATILTVGALGSLGLITLQPPRPVVAWLEGINAIMPWARLAVIAVLWVSVFRTGRARAEEVQGS